MNLIIDIGNTRVKWAVFKDGFIEHQEDSAHDRALYRFNELREKYSELEQVIIAATADIPQALPGFIKAHLPLTIVDAQTPVPFTNQYSTPKTLGPDRIALVAAAATDYPKEDVLIIDAGTCLTYDLKNKENTYLGGAISPGIATRYESLFNAADKLPWLDKEPFSEDMFIGSTTQLSIHSGVILGTVMEIRGMIELYREQFTDLTVILTGGDMLFLLDHIKNDIFANPNFLLEGLNYILEFNKD